MSMGTKRKEIRNDDSMVKKLIAKFDRENGGIFTI